MDRRFKKIIWIGENSSRQYVAIAKQICLIINISYIYRDKKKYNYNAPIAKNHTQKLNGVK